jgi:hypothetical protein
MKELTQTESAVAVTIPAGMEAELSSELRALSAIIVNMLARHTHSERRAVLRFALEKEKFIPVAKTSVFSGTAIERTRLE